MIMSYLRRKTRVRRSAPPMGDVASTIGSALSSISGTIGTAGAIASDPYLPEVICHIEQLAQIKRREPVKACAAIPAGRPGGIGLGKGMIPLRAYVYAERNPWAWPVGIGAALGIPMLLGYVLGKKG